MLSVTKYIKTKVIGLKNRNNLYIHTIGDSHAKIPWEIIVIPKVSIQIHYLGPRLMHSVGENEKLLKLNGYNLRENDIIIFCFGEIDCRCHVWKFNKFGYKTVINNLVDRYFSSIRNNVEKLKNMKICFYNVIPPVEREKHKHNETHDFPFLGMNQERKSYVNYMNKKLDEKCLENGYLFFNVYNNYCNDAGFLNFELSDGNVHIGNPQYINSFIKNNFL
ncbi:MAG: hypothetical protein H8E85_04370 [Candidatus Marinimicrobia bacterium]|nr:hypothetical protein [Candidatus Neomarinimicrobiota bacterium]